MYVDRTKSAADNMLALLNTTNDAALTFADIQLGAPTALPPVYLPPADPEDPDEPKIVDRSADNASVLVTGKGDFSEEVTLTYRRLDLDFEVQFLRYEANEFTDWSDFKTKFAVKNDIRVEELIFTPDAMPTDAGLNVVTVTTAPTSWLYFGDKTIRINV
jgi:hypothetical protein